ncbi:uncharacterized protein BcabD6B2_26360 [Babesia caballi]|uniref:Rad60/SUMO-like domain-containing protein n=1 Tax=Babesia caballi TaxID=5871 RepID=A0AAV4LTN9_BABCB|nr:hypothetical protein, conserved [Babesia caballi]
MSNPDDPLYEDIFSEDIKDHSLFMIHSSDEDDSESCEQINLTPPQSKSLERGQYLFNDVLSDKVNRQARLDDELYDQKLKTDNIFSEIHRFFEQSVASLAAAGTEPRPAGENIDDGRTQKPSLPGSKSPAEDGNVNASVRLKHRKVGAEAPIQSEKRKRKKSNRYGFNDDAKAYKDGSDEDYQPEGRVPSEKARRRSRKKPKQSRETIAKDGAESLIDSEKPMELVGQEIIVNDEEKQVAKVKKQTKRMRNSVRKSDPNAGKGDDPVSTRKQPSKRRGAGNAENKKRGSNVERPQKTSNQHKADDSAVAKADGIRDICLKFVILDENRSVIKDSRLDNVYVRQDETIGNLAAKFGKLFNLDENKYKDIAIYIDGDPQPHDTTIGSDELGIEDGMQVDVRFPPKPIVETQNVFVKPSEEVEHAASGHKVEMDHVEMNTVEHIQLFPEPGPIFFEVIEID